jgi:hypothetical protein
MNIFEPYDQEPSLSPSFKNIATPQMNKRQEAKREPQSVKLPRLATRLTYDERDTKVKDR